MPKKERVKRTRAKPKNVIQKVVVNVGGRGGGGRKTTAPSGPPRPTPLQQATQFVQSSLARDASLVQSFQQPRQGESMVQSAQVLQRLLDPINARLDAIMQSNMRQQAPSINITHPPINITNPPINIRQPDIFMAPPNVSINQRFPDINIQMPNQRDRVADLPDEPLVRPNAPLVLAGPMRMDDPHEDVPLDEVDPALVGKQEAKAGDESSEEEAEAGPFGRGSQRVGTRSDSLSAETEPAQAGAKGSNFNYEFFTLADINRLVVRRKPDNLSDIPSLEEVVQYFGIRIPTKKRNKEDMIQLLRQKVPNFRYE
jgi:hypothetical protein